MQTVTNTSKAKQIVEELLAKTEITLNGDKPCDPQVHDERFYARILREGTLGLGESYMDGWWDCEELDSMIDKLIRADLEGKIKDNWTIMLKLAWQAISNPARKSKAFEIGQQHYDLGNDLYEAMLDPRMTYTCGYWKDAKNLNDAQEAKLDLICRKIGAKQGDNILDIGSGWGSFIGYAAEKYSANTTGYTVSKEQKEFADVRYKDQPVETVLEDYRNIQGTFDHIVSVGMFEHVGYQNYRTFMEVVHRSLKEDGLFLLHTIGNNVSVKTAEPWIGKYIFTNSMLPSPVHVTKAIEGLFIIEDWHNFSSDYDDTLMAWYRNFERNWDSLKSNYSERFYRMWRYYLLFCAGTFRSRKNQLWQIVLSKNGVRGGYTTVR